MYLLQILLPVFDNESRRFDTSAYVKLRSELAERFGGVTAYTRAPARGVWIDDAGAATRDDIVIFEVMTEELDQAWWTAFRERLEVQFRQESIIVRALTTTRL